MNFILHPWHLLIYILASWVNRHQQDAIDYLRTERRRWSSLSRIRRFPSFALSIRFSVSKYSMASCWCRLSQPARMTLSNGQGSRMKFIVHQMQVSSDPMKHQVNQGEGQVSSLSPSRPTYCNSNEKSGLEFGGIS